MNNMNADELIVAAKKYLAGAASLVKEHPVEGYIKYILFSLYAYHKCSASLIGPERKAFKELFEKAFNFINMDSLVKRIHVNSFEYVQGQELKLFNELRQVPQQIHAIREEDGVLMHEAAQREKNIKLKRAINLANTCKFDGAMSQFNQLSKQFSDDYDLHKNISWALFENKHVECLTFFEKCVELNPRDDAAYAAMGQVLRKMKKYALAEEAYLNALDIDPENVVYIFNLARVYIDSRRWSDAKAVLVELLKIDPDLQPAQQALQFVTSSFKDID